VRAEKLVTGLSGASVGSSWDIFPILTPRGHAAQFGSLGLLMSYNLAVTQIRLAWDRRHSSARAGTANSIQNYNNYMTTTRNINKLESTIQHTSNGIFNNKIGQ
jgi:hypothetical protein